MAERKPIVIISGLLQELNVGTDKMSLSGNSTTDLSEGTNLYFTNARARGAVSVTDAGGQGSLAYNSSTGVITYTGPSSADTRGTLSVASGEGLTYDASTGEFGTSAIPNSQLANDDVTIGSTAVALGSTVTDFAGLGQLVMSDLIVGSGAGAANAINIQSGQVIFEGSTADANETILSAADATGGDKSLILPNESGTILSTGSSIANSNLANSSIVLGSATVNLGDTVSGLSLTNIQATTKLQVGAEGGAGNIVLHADNSGGFSRGITFEGTTGGADANETLLAVTDPTADRTITLPDATGTVALLSTLSVASASGLSYNSSTGEFSTNAIPNSQLANNTVTVGTTGIALGSSATTIAGLTSITSDAVVTNDDGFRIRDNSDNTKQVAFECSGITGSTTRTLTIPDASGTIALVGGGTTVFADDVFRVTDNSDASKKLAFECSGISGSTTRTMTVPNENGTISTESFATAIAVALG